jgi:hypothetical protein
MKQTASPPARWYLLVALALAAGACSPSSRTAGAGGSGAPGGQGGTTGPVPIPRGGNQGGGAGAGAGGAGVAGGGGSSAIDAGPGVSLPPPKEVSLPLVVTDNFLNRGWFGDASIAKFFTTGSTMIKEVASTAGPCAARPAGAKGKCLQITYTPPAGLAPPAVGAFVGVYMLDTLRLSHPETTPPQKIGDPNWGIEPGIPVAPGARRVAFYAAAEQPNVRVAFRAGTDQDTMALPESTQVLGTAWTQFSMSLAGGEIGAGLVGGFAWTFKDTARPVTFYLDDIAWDAEGVPPPTPPMGKRDGVRQFVFINRCQEPVFVGMNSGMGVPEGGGFRIDAGQTHTVTMPAGKWSGRIWGRTGCNFGAGAGGCETGDCGGGLGCAGGGKTPATLAEITLSGGEAEPDFYDISLVDGYNLPMAIAPLPGSFTHSRAPYDCLIPSCVSDLNATCPGDLQLRNGGGKVVGCLSACEKTKSDQFCCKGTFGQPETCPPFDAAKIFKTACPTSYSYAYDDATSTFTCRGEDYAIWFCPQPGKP